MQIKHVTGQDDLYLISEILDVYYEERLELAAIIIPALVAGSKGNHEHVYNRLSNGIYKFFVDQLMINNHECDILEKMLRYLQLMETNNKMDEYNRKYRVLFYKIIMELEESLDQRSKASMAFTRAAITGFEHETTDLAIASNVDFMTPHLSSEQIENYKEMIPRK